MVGRNCQFGPPARHLHCLSVTTPDFHAVVSQNGNRRLMAELFRVLERCCSIPCDLELASLLSVTIPITLRLIMKSHKSYFASSYAFAMLSLRVTNTTRHFVLQGNVSRYWSNLLRIFFIHVETSAKCDESDNIISDCQYLDFIEHPIIHGCKLLFLLLCHPATHGCKPLFLPLCL